MKRQHAMPFGAQVVDGGIRFRLWAPGAASVGIEIEANGERCELPANSAGDGWFERVVVGLGAGARYEFRIDGQMNVPDPASRCNPDDVHRASLVVDPTEYAWQDREWKGRRWEDAVIYEMHVGTFTPEGTFAAALERLDHLVALGVTALELMPVADFPGRRNWGYDGVLPFAPDSSYGPPNDLKRLIDAAHLRGLMVLLDVVYNHFGPEGNYLHAYAPLFFSQRHQTPWGAAINFDGKGSRVVRDFFIHNALFWLEEYHFDGLRLDAIHAIADESPVHIVAELATTVRQRFAGRHVHLVLENDLNQTRWLDRDAAGHPSVADAQWNDDIHHALHVLATGEGDGYYADYSREPLAQFGRCLAEGFAYQGEASEYRDGAARGEPSKHLPSTAFVNFTQTHDQVGNRAFGERLVALADRQRLRAAMVCVLLAPSIPMIFMGEEFGASTPFLFFCDFGTDLAAAVTRGRRQEFGRFDRFRDPVAQAAIPDPNAESSFAASKLDWQELERAPHDGWLALYRECLQLRARAIAPRLPARDGRFRVADDGLLAVEWTLNDGNRLLLTANFADARMERRYGTTKVIYSQRAVTAEGTTALEPGAVVVTLGRA